MGAQEEGSVRHHGELGSLGRRRSEKDEQVRHSWLLHDQNSTQASHQSRQEDGLRQRSDREGQASQDRRQGIPSCCYQGAVQVMLASWTFSLRAVISLARFQRSALRGNPTGGLGKL